MNIKKIIIVSGDEFQRLEKVFTAKNGDMASMTKQLFQSYIPSAISHGLETGAIGAFNRAISSLVLTHNVSKFARVVDVCAPFLFNADTKRFISTTSAVKDGIVTPEKAKDLRSKYKKQRADLLENGFEAKYLEALNKVFEKDSKETFQSDEWRQLKALKTVIKLFPNQAISEQAEELAQGLEAVVDAQREQFKQSSALSVS